MLEGDVVAHQRAGTVLTLRDGIVPVLDTPAFAENHILIVGYIACGIDVGLVRFEKFIHHHAVL